MCVKRWLALSSSLSFCQSFHCFFLHTAESDVFSKVRVCAAQRSNESPSGAFKRQNGLAQQDGGASPRQVPAAGVRRTVSRNEQRRGITMEVVPCLLLCIPLYCAFQVNRCVRPYMVGTHVRRKMAKFHYIGVFFHGGVWYTRLSPVNRSLKRRYVL